MPKAPRYDRRNTEPDVNELFQRPQSVTRHSHGPDRLSQFNEKDGLNEMAEFLMKQPPPPSNFMTGEQFSIEKRHANIKHSAMKIFTRNKLKNASFAEEPFQLPDSAVCARTIGGARHIAISIPIDHAAQNLPETNPNSVSPTKTTHNPNSAPEELDNASPSGSSRSLTSMTFFKSEKQKRPNSMKSSSASDYDSNLKSQHTSLRETYASSSREKSTSKSVALPLHERWSWQGIPQVESFCSPSSLTQLAPSSTRHSFRSLKVRNDALIRSDMLPERISSRNRVPIPKESTQISAQKIHSVSLPSTPPKFQSKSTSTSPLVFGTGTAKLARSFSGAGVEKAHIVRCTTPNLPLALESIPKASNLSTSSSTLPLTLPCHAKETPPKKNCSAATEIPWSATLHPNKLKRGSFSASAVRSFDCDSYPNLLPDSPISPRSVTHSYQTSQQKISFSRIMTVTSVAPDYDLSSKRAPGNAKRKISRKTNVPHVDPLSTSPDSITSDTDESAKTPEYSFSRQQSIYSSCSWDSTFGPQSGSHRKQRNSRKSLAAVDQELNLRLSRMERGNALLITALNELAKKFDHMSDSRPLSSENKNIPLKNLVDEDFPWCDEFRKGEKSNRIIFNNVRF